MNYSQKRMRKEENKTHQCLQNLISGIYKKKNTSKEGNLTSHLESSKTSFEDNLNVIKQWLCRREEQKNANVSVGAGGHEFIEEQNVSVWLLKTSFNCTEAVFTTRYQRRLEGKADWISADLNLHLNGRENKMHLCDPQGENSHSGMLLRCDWIANRPQTPLSCWSIAQPWNMLIPGVEPTTQQEGESCDCRTGQSRDVSEALWTNCDV